METNNQMKIVLHCVWLRLLFSIPIVMLVLNRKLYFCFRYVQPFLYLFSTINPYVWFFFYYCADCCKCIVHICMCGVHMVIALASGHTHTLNKTHFTLLAISWLKAGRAEGPSTFFLTTHPSQPQCLIRKTNSNTSITTLFQIHLDGRGKALES